MRPLLTTLAFISLVTTAMAFPPALTPEQPVWQRFFGGAARHQQMVAMASDGQIAFAVWFDQRRGEGERDLFGSRIDSTGASLDPFGIPIATGVTGGTVIWNGTAFVVVSESGCDTTFSFISPEGVIVAQKSLQLGDYGFAASLGSGPAARVLFVDNFGRATIVDSSGNVVKSGAQLGEWEQPRLLVAGASESEFLVLHDHTGVGNKRFVTAERLDRDGKLLSSVDTGIELAVVGRSLALAGGANDYLLVGRGEMNRSVVGIHLDRSGVANGAPRLFEQLDPTAIVTMSPIGPFVPTSRPAMLRDGDGYRVAWTTSGADGRARTSLVWERAGGAVVPFEFLRPLEWTGTGYGTSLAKIGTQWIVVADAYRSGVSTGIDSIGTAVDGGGSFDLSSSATLQTLPQVATTTNVYAVVWNELGPDAATHLYLRRFWAVSGAPLDAAPIEITTDTGDHTITARIAAVGDTYAVVWSTPDTAYTSNYFVRRLSATTGAWIDAEPVLLAAHAFELALGSNRDRVLAVYAAGGSW